MGVRQPREIVVEFEQVRIIRKRAMAHLAFCHGCGTRSDMVSLNEAAGLFGAGSQDLFYFLKENGCHYHIDHGGMTQLCIASLLANMKTTQISGKRLRSKE
jgi:hypothetical protein